MDGIGAITNISSVGTMIVLVGYMIYKCIKHLKCRSICCGNKTEVEIDLEPEPNTVALQPKPAV